MQRIDAPFCYCANALKALEKSEGINPRILLSDLGIAPNKLEKPHQARVTERQQLEIYERIASVSSLPGLGFRAWQEGGIDDMGLFGLALLNCSTVRELFEFNKRFLNIQRALLLFDYDMQFDYVRIWAYEGPALTRSLRQLVVEEILSVWTSFPVPGMVDRSFSLRMKTPRPTSDQHWAYYDNLVPGREWEFQFDQRFKKDNIVMEARLALDVLDLELEKADPTIPAMLSELFQAELANEGAPEVSLQLMNHFIMHAPLRKSSSVWRKEHIAPALGFTSVKKFNRALDTENTSFSKLKRQAQELLYREYQEADLLTQSRILGFTNPQSMRNWKRLTFE